MGKNDTKPHKKKATTQVDKNHNKNNFKSNDKGSKSSQPLSESPTSTEDTDKLREQILSLGGTRGDITFLQDIDNDDTGDMITNDDDTSTAALQNELKNFIKNMGFSSTIYDQFGEQEDKHVETEPEMVDDVVEESDNDNGTDNDVTEDSSEEEEEEEEEEESGSDTEESGDATETPIVTKQVAPKENTIKDKNAKLAVEPSPYWYNTELTDIPLMTSSKDKLTQTQIDSKYEFARSLLEKENEDALKSSSLSSSDRNFMSNIMQSGTLNDKVSALTLLIQESPLHGLKALDTIMSMTKKKGRKEANMAVLSLKDLFVGSALPDRKLRYFADQPLHHPDTTNKHLILWVFEDFMKKYYFEYIQQIEALSHDTLMHIRYSMVNCLHDLLAGKPEQEQNLLKLLVNKLGDAENKVAAKSSQKLNELMVQHPGMKMYVVREIEQLLLRPSITQRTQYYAVITLNQTILTGKDSTVANKLVELYFTFFRRLMKLTEDEDATRENQDAEEEGDNKQQNDPKARKNKKQLEREKKEAQRQSEVDEYNSKMIAAILTGVNRAFHFSTLPDEVFEKHMQVLFKITHAGTFNTAIQALSLIFSISLAKQTQSDRFYRTLYESMFDPRLLTSSKQAMYLNLLFKAISADDDIRRVKAFVKRTVQIAGYHQPPFICGLFYTLSQIMDKKPALRAMLTTPEENDDEERFVDATDDDEENDKEDKVDPVPAQQPPISTYDGRKRDPQYSNAERTCLWELIPFKDHYHPSVVKYADSLFKGESIEANPDLHHHTLMHFLDRFVYRNAKKNVTTKGSSIMQPLANRRDGGVLLTKGAAGMDPNTIPMNSEQFWRKKVEQVPVDEIFFHKYFNQKAATGPAKEGKGKDEQDEEDQVWRAMMASVPGGLDDNDDVDLDMDEDDEDDEAMRALLMENDDDEEVLDGSDDDDNVDNDFESEGDSDDLGDDDDIEFMNASSMDEQDDDDAQVAAPKKKKRTTSAFEEDEQQEEKPKKKKQKQASLPTFASYEDYAALLDKDEVDLE
ncbi:CBF/Mak21 family-domain-containing protein [Chlamydoabsidia padenii]|nr:CBF/Mak21 family-domain-containing protein [Chlamydoabsidia padenii]